MWIVPAIYSSSDVEGRSKLRKPLFDAAKAEISQCFDGIPLPSAIASVVPIKIFFNQI